MPEFKKKITQVVKVPFTDKVQKLIYADGSFGYRSIDPASPDEGGISDQPLTTAPQHAMEWAPAQDEPSATKDEMEYIQDEMEDYKQRLARGEIDTTKFGELNTLYPLPDKKGK